MIRALWSTALWWNRPLSRRSWWWVRWCCRWRFWAWWTCLRLWVSWCRAPAGEHWPRPWDPIGGPFCMCRPNGKTWPCTDERNRSNNRPSRRPSVHNPERAARRIWLLISWKRACVTRLMRFWLLRPWRWRLADRLSNLHKWVVGRTDQWTLDECGPSIWVAARWARW